MVTVYISLAVSVLFGICCCSLVSGDDGSFVIEATPTTLNSMAVTDSAHFDVTVTPSSVGDDRHSQEAHGALEAPSTVDEGSGSDGIGDSDVVTQEFTTIQEYLTDEYLLPTTAEHSSSSSTLWRTEPTTTNSKDVVSTNVTEPSSSIDGSADVTHGSVTEEQSLEITSSVAPEYPTSPFEETSLPDLDGYRPPVGTTLTSDVATTESSVTSVDVTTEDYITATDTTATGSEISNQNSEVTTDGESLLTISSTTAETHTQQQVTHSWMTTPSTPEVPGFTEASTSEVTMTTPADTTQKTTMTSSSETSPYVITDDTTTAIEVSTSTMSIPESPPPSTTTGDVTTTVRVSSSIESTDSSAATHSAVTTTESPQTGSEGLSIGVLVNSSTETAISSDNETTTEEVTVTSLSTFETSSEGPTVTTDTTELPIMKNVKSYDNLTESEFFNSVTVIFRKPLEIKDSSLMFFNQDVFKKVVICLINAYEFEGWTNETIDESVCDYENKDKQPSASNLTDDFQPLKPNDLVIVYPSPKTSDDTEIVSFFVKNSTSTVAGRIVARNHTLTALDRHRHFLGNQMNMEVADIEARIPVQLLITSDSHRSFNSLLLVVLLASVLFCIGIIVVGVVFIKCRSRSGRWEKKSHDKTQLQSNAMRSETGAHHLNSDEDIRKDENQLVWRNGNGCVEGGNARNGDRHRNGGECETVIPISENDTWVVPFSDLTPDEKTVSETLDTKL